MEAGNRVSRLEDAENPGPAGRRKRFHRHVSGATPLFQRVDDADAG
jgi:hypothetical protein